MLSNQQPSKTHTPATSTSFITKIFKKLSIKNNNQNENKNENENGSESEKESTPLQISREDIQLKKEVGKGGFGAVCFAIWNGMEVAIKQLNIKQDQVALKYEHEKNIMHKITQLQFKTPNVNIIKLFGCIEDEVSYSLVMEYMPNGELFDFAVDFESKYKQRHGIDLLYRIARDVANGLSFLHQYEIIHCDIKLENIMLDANFRAKIIDYGFAKTKKELEESKSKDVCGSPYYVAPELLLLGTTAYSEKSDIYAYSIMLYMLFTQQGAYPLAYTNQKIYQLVCDNIRPIIPKKCPNDIAGLVKLTWMEQPKDRLSAPQIVEKLDSFIQNRNFSNNN